MKKLFTLLFAIMAIVSTTFATVTNELNKNESIPLDAVYHADFRNFKSSLLGWFVEDKLLPDQFNYIWMLDSRYGMRASGYLNGSNHKTESWLISDPIDLSSNTVATFSMSHARKFGELSDLSVQISKDGYSWQTLTIPYWPDGTNWTFINSGEVDITPYISTTTQIAFVYKSTTSSSATWEIGEVLIKGDGKYIDNEILPSGTCGENSFWEYENSTLTISGNGKMHNYLWIPWSGKSGEIEKIIIQAEVSDIVEYAFRGITVTNYNFINHSELDAENHNYWGAEIVDVEVDGLLIRNDTIFACRPYVSSVVIPNTITYIVSNTFDNCSSLTSVVWNAKNCDSSPFYDLSSQITSFTFGESVEHIPAYLCYRMNNLTSITIPNSVTSIGDGAFAYCEGLTSITIPNSVTSIGGSAFEYCTGLKSITIPNSVTSIGDIAFYGCSSLTSITIPNSVTSIGRGAFDGCESLTSITIPNSVTSIGDRAFASCSGLTSIIVEDANSTYDSRDNCNAIIETATNTLIAGCQNTVLPNSVTSIGESAFFRCSGLTYITIPNSVTSIGDQAFSYCSGLTSITIPNSVTSIGDGAFRDCSGLTSINIPNSVTSIGDWAFRYCSGLTSIIIPNSVTSIGDYAFYDCSNLKKIYLEPTTPPALGIDVFNSKPEAYVHWSSLEVYADSEWKDYVSEFKVFIHYSGVLDNGITWKYDNGKLLISGNGALIYQRAPWIPLIDSIQSIEMINGITSISESAFANYKKLTKVTLPASLEEIGANAFYNCPRLYEIYSYASLPPIAQLSSFYNYNADVYVPCEVLSFYEKDMVFSLFPNLQCISSDEVPTDDVVINTGSTDVTITWPTEENADTYSIVIKKDGKVVCTLTFNSEGQLLNIAFAPGREGNHPAQYAEAAANGYRFTVTGLDESTKYAYNLDVNDSLGKTIKSYEGEFTTQSTTALDNTHSQSPMTNVQKIFRDGQLLIIRDGKTYNAQGVELK